MMEAEPLSMDKMAMVLDNAPVAVYVSGIDNWELLYANRLAQEWFIRKAHSRKTTCYYAAGFDRPCPFCRAEKMSASDLYVREFEHPGNGRIYQLSGKIIDWGGRPAHIEYVLDVTERKQKEKQTDELDQELRRTFSSLPCGLCVYRFDGKKITPYFHNQAFYDIMGYSEENIRRLEQQTEFLGVHPEDLPLLQEKIQKMLLENGVLNHTYRVYSDRQKEYRWIQLVGSVKQKKDSTKILYGVYTDVSVQKRLEQERTDANEKMQDIINAIPGGVAIYKAGDILETVYFSDGVPALSGYTVEEYEKLMKGDAMDMTYQEDTSMVAAKVAAVIQSRGTGKLEFRKQHRDGHIVWVRVQIKWIGEEDGRALLHCVFYNISDLKEAQLEMDHLVNSIPGGIASYQVEGERFVPVFYSDGVMALSGHTREEFWRLVGYNALDIIYEPDKERVTAAAKKAIESGEVLDVSYRMYHKDGSLIWIHVNGRRIGPLSETTRFYAVFTGMSAEARLFQNIANETADGIYVIEKDTYGLLYANESGNMFMKKGNCLGDKCYHALHGKNAPCSFCTLETQMPGGEEHVMAVDRDRFYSTHFRETDWNGIPAYVKYVRDITEEVNTRKEKERLEMYFQSVIANLPGGVSVIRCEADGRMVPEFISDGFAAMTDMTVEEAEALYGNDCFAGLHPKDARESQKKLQNYVEAGEGHCELTARMRRGAKGYIWVRAMFSILKSKDGVRRLYTIYTDISREMEEKEQLRRQYEDLLLQHYRTPGPNALIVGHCNVTQNKIIEIIDHTDSGLLRTFGDDRQEFFTGLSGLVVEEEERQRFLNTYLNGPAAAAFKRNDVEQILKCFVKLPQEKKGRYVQFKVNLVETPDTGDITGILTVTDITEQTISDRILHQLSVTGFDFVIDLNLEQDTFTVLNCDKKANCLPEAFGSHSRHVRYMCDTFVVPKDREYYTECLDPSLMRRRLMKEGRYTFSFSLMDKNGDIRTKNMTVSAIDLSLGRVCLLRTDITESMREQQGLLNMMAYTFELMAFIDIIGGRFTMYTREAVLENLPPYRVEDYDSAISKFADYYVSQDGTDEMQDRFRLENMLRKLEEKPAGFDFVFLYKAEDGLRYKQINVLWGDQNHRTVCMVRADVTEMLAVEREAKTTLQNALVLAREANQAKSDFLSAMSHDIRTPMNAIMGMTALATAHLDDRDKVADCLRKISISSKHLLSLINDVLDMSKIEQAKISLNRMKIWLPDLMEQLSAIMTPQARDGGVEFCIRSGEIEHEAFYGDSLRISQILINILGNAVKFTPKGGRVEFEAEEISPHKDPDKVRYQFTVKDTGMGMSEEFLKHIFDPFSRSSSAARIEGTGLGLSITKGLVEVMGGEISVESHVNEGSTFWIELECEPAVYREERLERTDGTGALEEDAEEIFRGRLFLIAEDNPINAEILSELLEMYGADSVVKADGVQAVRAFCEAPPQTYDAVLMDIQMPEMNGYEATRAIRGLERADAGKVPIIAMTANAFAEDVQASVDAGMNAHVAKPIDIDLLRMTLSTVLDRREDL